MFPIWSWPASIFLPVRQMAQELKLEDDVTLSVLARQPDVFASVRAQQDEQALWENVSEIAQQALEAFCKCAALRAKNSKRDIEARLCRLEQMVGQVEQGSEQRVKAYTERLYERLKAGFGRPQRGRCPRADGSCRLCR